ncbi:hypothetical protein ACEWY4_025041 [Coilia grayii]|uniref:Fibronectin type-III domain-containing protein n=1 Tax=Coilia grayii TaxID=363190 RepID=A0ABD1IWF4_9TELE
MSHLGRGQVSHPNVFEDDTATHIVTAILYGASAYFVFDRESSLSDKKKNLELEAKLMMRSLTADVGPSFNMDEKQKSAVENFSCTFYGDFQLSSNPTSFSEAVNVYQQLPKMLGENGECAVPVRVWLYPLVKLDSKAARLQRDISNRLITYSSEVIEHLNKTEMRCNDLLKDTAATTFSAMNEKLQTFILNCHHYKLEFMQKLGTVLPSIRGGGKEESALEDILKTHEMSPFNRKDLDQWLTKTEKESNTLKSFLMQLEKLGAKMDDNLDDLLSDLSVKNIVSFSFTTVDQPEGFLAKLSNFLKPTGMVGEYAESDDLHTKSTDSPSTDTRQRMKRQLQLFDQLTKLTTKGDTKFTVTSKYDQRYPGACILIYEDGSDEPVPFISPSKPDTPTTSDVSYDRLTVRVSDPDSDTVECQVEFRMKEDQEEEQDNEWTSHPVQKNQESVTLSGLKPDTEYEIRATVVGKLGYAVSGDAVTIKTKAFSPPTNVKVTEVKTDSITLEWLNPEREPVKQYIIEFQEENCSDWQKEETKKEVYTFSLKNLKQNTTYYMKMCADGGVGMSKPGELLRTTTKKGTDVPVPEELTVKKTATSAHLSWTVPASMERTDHTFLVSYGCRGKSSQFISTASCSTVITGLQPHTEYTINVSTVCENGGESQPASKTILTGEDSETLRVKSLSPTSVEVSWSLSQEMNRTPRKFLISYICEETELQTITTDSCSTVIKDLKEDSQYLFAISTNSESGQTVELASAIFCTDVPPPGPVQITSETPNSVSLMWKSLGRKYSYRVTRKCCRLESSFTVWDSSVTIQAIGPEDVLEMTIVTLGRNNRQSSTSTTVRYQWTGIPPPTNVEVRNNRVTWRKPAGLDQVSFLLTVCSKGRVMFNVNTENTECTIPKDALQLGSSYVMYLTTIVNNAQSSPNIVAISEDGTLTQDKEAHSKQSQLPTTLSYADAKATSTQHGMSHSTSYRQESLLPTSEGARSKYSDAKNTSSQCEEKRKIFSMTPTYEGKKYYIHASGKTLKYCSDFKNVWLQRLAEVKSVDASDMVLAVCMVVSRVGTDVEAALKEIPGNKPTVLVVMHHTFDPHYVVPDSRKYARRDDMLVVDCLFYEDQGLLRCETNSKAQSTVLKWIDAKVVGTQPKRNSRIMGMSRHSLPAEV